MESRSHVSTRYSTTSHRSQASSRSSSRSIATSRAKEKAKAAELMARVAILEQKKELEKKVEKLRLEEQLAVARVREGVFEEIESGVKGYSSVRQKMPPEAFRVPGSSFSGPFYPTVSSIYTAPTVSSNTATYVNFSADSYDAPAIQNPPKLQDLCRTKLSWDDEIGKELRVRWEKWRSQLPALEQFSMERCLKPKNFGTVVSRQVHSFSDASSTGYGKVTYLRMENERGDIHCAFLMGKDGVAPVKTMTIPCLELTAATVSLRVGEMIARELDEPVESKNVWTDSTTVLKYLHNDKRRFHVFVANRVQTIRDATYPHQWRYVESKRNPADDESRGLSGHELITGPKFLWLPESEWPQLPCDLGDISVDDPEVKKIQVHSMDVNESTNFLTRLTRFSDWQRLRRSIAWILRLKPKQGINKDGANRARHVEIKPLRVEELDRAEKSILKLVRSGAFPKEIEAFQKIQRADCESDRQFVKAKKSEVKTSSALYRLDPFLDQDGLIRVGGRLGNSQEFPEDLKLPVILPKESFIVDLVVRDVHAKVSHAGRGIKLNELRSQYWIVNANSVVRHLISKCVVCRRVRGTTGE